jgi:hypothetical protein
VSDESALPKSVGFGNALVTNHAEGLPIPTPMEGRSSLLLVESESHGLYTVQRAAVKVAKRECECSGSVPVAWSPERRRQEGKGRQATVGSRKESLKASWLPFLRAHVAPE